MTQNYYIKILIYKYVSDLAFFTIILLRIKILIYKNQQFKDFDFNSLKKI